MISFRGRQMLVQASQGQSGSAHVVVLGNEKGGSGKSTTALHIAVALLKAGQRVASIDLDCRQQSFTRYISNRSAWARRTGLGLELPVHRCIKLGETMQIAENENSEFQQFMEAVSAVESSFDFIVIDTPRSASRGGPPPPPPPALPPPRFATPQQPRPPPLRGSRAGPTFPRGGPTPAA